VSVHEGGVVESDAQLVHGTCPGCGTPCGQGRGREEFKKIERKINRKRRGKKGKHKTTTVTSTSEQEQHVGRALSCQWHQQ